MAHAHILEKALASEAFMQCLYDTVVSAIFNSTDAPSTLTSGTQSSGLQYFLRVGWERRRADAGAVIRYIYNSEFWYWQEQGVPIFFFLGKAGVELVQLNAAKGCEMLAVAGEESLFGDDEVAPSKFFVLIDPSSTLQNPKAWLVATIGISRVDNRTVIHKGYVHIDNWLPGRSQSLVTIDF
jgi:hypothetical protein